jgi:hypothetical protein
MTDALPEARRKEAFAALIAAQDAGASVPASRAKVAADFGVEVDEVVSIEKEGVQEQWPPLGE